ncbi:hypothetical protein VaNZ11_013533 [Volvox africanus]|uniref:Uncharacterized protein n=1 Tax=Volvox africanus TaxID=51714 RepID=A0ABQ5SH98_9CHLO|nr:hypothetical protein VaNZ11_013533 [Volvox africanus]
MESAAGINWAQVWMDTRSSISGYRLRLPRLTDLAKVTLNSIVVCTRATTPTRLSAPSSPSSTQPRQQSISQYPPSTSCRARRARGATCSRVRWTASSKLALAYRMRSKLARPLPEYQFASPTRNTTTAKELRVPTQKDHRRHRPWSDTSLERRAVEIAATSMTHSSTLARTNSSHTLRSGPGRLGRLSRRKFREEVVARASSAGGTARSARFCSTLSHRSVWVPLSSRESASWRWFHWCQVQPRSRSASPRSQAAQACMSRLTLSGEKAMGLNQHGESTSEIAASHVPQVRPA